jgi:hypothetical protein
LALLLSHAARQKELGGPSQPALPRPPPPPVALVEPWVVKHAPRTTPDLVVHNRKVQDVRDWLLARLASAGMPAFGDSSLLINGTQLLPMSISRGMPESLRRHLSSLETLLLPCPSGRMHSLNVPPFSSWVQANVPMFAYMHICTHHSLFSSPNHKHMRTFQATRMEQRHL